MKDPKNNKCFEIKVVGLVMPNTYSQHSNKNNSYQTETWGEEHGRAQKKKKENWHLLISRTEPKLECLLTLTAVRTFTLQPFCADQFGAKALEKMCIQHIKEKCSLFAHLFQMIIANTN